MQVCPGASTPNPPPTMPVAPAAPSPDQMCLNLPWMARGVRLTRTAVSAVADFHFASCFLEVLGPQHAGKERQLLRPQGCERGEGPPKVLIVRARQRLLVLLHVARPS